MSPTTELAVVGTGKRQPAQPATVRCLIGPDSVGEITRHMDAGRMFPADVARALLETPRGNAVATLAAMSPVYQAAIVNAGIGGGDEVPHLLMLSSDSAVQVVVTDACLCHHLGGEGGLSEIVREGLTEELDDGSAGLPDWRIVTIATRSGEEQDVPIVIDPHRAFVYLKTVAEAKGSWQEAVLDELGDLLTFVFCHYHSGSFQDLDGEDWEDFRNSLPEEVFDAAFMSAKSADFNPEGAESDIIAAHAASLHDLFILPQDVVAPIEGSADDLLDGLKV